MLPQSDSLDLADLPAPKMIAHVVLGRTILLVTMFFLFFGYCYDGQLNSTFLSVDPSAGICPSTGDDTGCCELPQALSGTYLIDTSGHWNTEPGEQGRNPLIHI
jgi:hypothetical protein